MCKSGLTYLRLLITYLIVLLMKSRVETNTKLVISVLIISCLVIPPNRDLMYVTWPVDNKTVHHYTKQISKSLGLNGYGESGAHNLSEFLLCFGKKVLSRVWLSTRDSLQGQGSERTGPDPPFSVLFKDIFRFSERILHRIPDPENILLKCFLSSYGQALLI